MGFPVFASGDVLNASDMNAVGLWKITSTSFTNVATLTLTNVFSNDYDYYKIVYRVNSTSTASGRILTFQLRNSGGTAVTSYVSGMRSFNPGLGTATWDIGGTSTTVFYGGYLGEPNFAPASGSMDLFNPFKTTHTTQTGQAYGLSSGVAYYNMTFGGHLQTTVSYTDLVVVPTADSMTGTVIVYGYRN